MREVSGARVKDKVNKQLAWDDMAKEANLEKGLENHNLDNQNNILKVWALC